MPGLSKRYMAWPCGDGGQQVATERMPSDAGCLWTPWAPAAPVSAERSEAGRRLAKRFASIGE